MAQDAHESIEDFLGGTPVNIQATNGAVVNFTVVIKVTRATDTLRRLADAIRLQEEYGVIIGAEFSGIVGGST